MSSIARYPKLVSPILFVLCLSLALATAPVALANGGGGGGSGGGSKSGGGATAAAGAVVKGLGLLTKWINGQNDNCAVAALAAAWGTDCKLDKEECTDTGFYTAECEKNVSNACGKARGKGYAYESAVGMWWSYETKPEASADAWPAHAGVENDTHGARGWAKASVDGTSEAEEEQDAMRTYLDGRATKGLDDYPPGTVIAALDIHSISLSTQSQATGASSSYTGTFVVNGSQVWSATASLDPAGNVTTTGGLLPSDFTVAYDATTGLYNASLSSYSFEVEVGYIAPGSGAKVQTDISYDSEVEAEGGTLGDAPTVIDVPLDDLTMIDMTTGMPVWFGETVRIAEPVTVTSNAYAFGPVLDTDVTNGNSSIGLLDPHLPAVLYTGDQVVGLVGTVSTHGGRAVLTDLSADAVIPGQPVAPPLSYPLQVALDQAEWIEGDVVTVTGLTLVDPAAWPTSQNLGTVQVTDGFSIFDLYVPMGSGIGGTEPPLGEFSATGAFSQSDIEEPYLDGYQLRLRSAADLDGTHGEPVEPGAPDQEQPVEGF